MKRVSSILKAFFTRISLLIVSIILVLSIAELFLRLIYPITWPAGGLHNYHKEDEVCGFDITENFPPVYHRGREYKYPIWSNELGCYDQPYRGEKGYILLLGDSFTWGYVPYAYKYGTLLENYLGVRVLKCGVMAYGTSEELIKARKVIAKTGRAPQLIILGYCLANDSIDSFLHPAITVKKGYLVKKTSLDMNTGEKKILSDAELEEKMRFYENPWSKPNTPALERLKFYLRYNSVIYDFLKLNKFVRATGLKLKLAHKEYTLATAEMYQSCLPLGKYPFMREAWQQNFRDLENFQETAESCGAKLLVLLIPCAEEIYAFLRPGGDYDWGLPNRIVTAFLKEKGIDYLDLNPIFQKHANLKPRKQLNNKKDLYYNINRHFTKTGERITGLYLARYLISQRLLEAEDSEKKLRSIEEEINSIR